MAEARSFWINTTEVGESGSPIAFLHGLFGQGKNFTQIAKALQPDFRSLLVDLPNHGKSDWTDSFDYIELADLIAEKLRSGIAAQEPVHLVGHSMGGKVAMVLALRHPELVERLVVVDISPVSGGSMGEFEHLLDSLASLRLEKLSRRKDADEALAEAIPQRTVRGFLLQNLRSSDDGFRWQANLELLRDELPAIGGFPTLNADRFEHPVLWVAGQKSPYIKPEHAPVMRELFPRTAQITIKDAGHWVHSERPEVFVSVLRNFLRAEDS
ncbi:MAG TPA: alpha/beta fold hydrolase [Arthrobacter sp.]|nr:alpha/beta fold hydrolase [Arthrobacter sp.]